MRAADILTYQPHIGLGDVEISVDGIEPLYLDERCAAWPNQITGINIPQSYAPVNRRFDEAVVVVDLGSFRPCLRFLSVCHSSIVFLLGYDVSSAQILLPL